MTDIFLSSSYEMENERQWWCRSGNPPEPEEIPDWFLKAAKGYGAKVVSNLTPGKLYLGQSYTVFFWSLRTEKPRQTVWNGILSIAAAGELISAGWVSWQRLRRQSRKPRI